MKSYYVTVAVVVALIIEGLHIAVAPAAATTELPARVKSWEIPTTLGRMFITDTGGSCVYTWEDGRSYGGIAVTTRTHLGC